MGFVLGIFNYCMGRMKTYYNKQKYQEKPSRSDRNDRYDNKRGKDRRDHYLTEIWRIIVYNNKKSLNDMAPLTPIT